MNRRVAPRHSITSPVNSSTSEEPDINLTQMLNRTYTFRWSSPKLFSILGNFQCRGSIERNGEGPTKKKAVLPKRRIEFTFVPKSFISSYMIAFCASWTQSRGLSMHMNLKPACFKILSDEPILALFGIRRCKVYKSLTCYAHCNCYTMEPPCHDLAKVKRLLASGVVSANDLFSPYGFGVSLLEVSIIISLSALLLLIRYFIPRLRNVKGHSHEYQCRKP
jgi:hypothetical protein